MLKFNFFHFINNYNRIFKSDSLNLSSGFKNLDNELPNNCWPKSCLIELLSNNSIESDISFIIPTLKQIIKRNQKIVIFSKNNFKYHDSFLSSGIPENLLSFIDSQSSLDKISKLNSERKIPIGAVVGWIEDEQSFIELQKIQDCLITTNLFSFLFRPLSIKDKPSPSPLRITLKDNGSTKIRLMVIKRRGPTVPIMFDLNVCNDNIYEHFDYVIFNKNHKMLDKFFYDCSKSLTH